MPPKHGIPATPPKIDPETQGTFFEVTDSTEHGELGTKVFTGEPTVPEAPVEPTPVVPEAEGPRVVDVNAELVEALNWLGRAGMHHALAEAPTGELRDHYNSVEIVARKRDSRPNAAIFERASQNALRRALGVPAPEEGKKQTLAEEVRETAFQRAWAQFKADYSGPENAAERRRFRNRLRKTGEPLVNRLVLFDPASVETASQPAPSQPTERPTKGGRKSVDLKKPMSLSRALQETHLNLDPTDYEDVSEKMFDLAHPARLGSYLMGSRVVRKAPTTLLYYRPDRNHRLRENRIAVKPADALILRRGLVALAKHGYNTTLASRPDKTDADREAAIRAMDHATEPKRTAIQQYVDGKLIPQSALIEKFSDVAKWWGLSQMGGEGNTRIKLTELDTAIIDDMVEAVSEQAELNHAQAIELKRAIFKHMISDRGDGKPDIQYTRKLLNIAQQYNRHLQNIAQDRLEEINQYLSQNAV